MIYIILAAVLAIIIIYRTYLVVFEMRLKRERKKAADEAVAKLVYIYGNRDEEEKSIRLIANVIDSLHARDDFFSIEEAHTLIQWHIKKYHT
jgi:predicted membrane protein